uniref:Uncharacterized protein n=1 Tax=Anguilla anguilla TaxID=7936 RepID=A0A0E9WP34_ANGAN
MQKPEKKSIFFFIRELSQVQDCSVSNCREDKKDNAVELVGDEVQNKGL